MPAYPHLMTRELNFKTIQQRVNAAHMLGAPYGERELSEASEVAHEQARQIVKELVEQGGTATVTNARGKEVKLEDTHVIALIAYMQRVGVDLFATADATEPETKNVETETAVDSTASTEIKTKTKDEVIQ